MRTRRLPSTLTLCALGWLVAEDAQAVPLTRGSAMELALRQNPQIAAARAVEAQAAAHGEQASAAGRTSVSLIAAVGPSLTASLVPGTSVQSTRGSTQLALDDLSIAIGGELQILQPLYTFGKISERQRAAGLERKAREAQTDLTRSDVAYEVANLYEAYLFARDALRFFEEMDRWLNRSIESTESEIESGSGATEQDLLRLNSATGAIRMGINRATAIMSQTASGLTAFLALPKGATAEPLEDALEMLPTAPPNKATLVNLAMRQRAEVRGLAAASGAYLALAEAEEAGNLPDFFAMAQLSAAYTPGRDWLDSRFVVDPLNHFVPSLFVGARWQWNGGMADARGAENRAQALEMQSKGVWAEAAVPAEVNRAFESVQRAFKDSADAEKSVSLTKKWLVSASADYGVGLGDSRNVTEAATAYVQMRIAAFDARFRHNVALAELAKVTGTLAAAESPFYPNRAASMVNPTPPGEEKAGESPLPSPGTSNASQTVGDDAAADVTPAEATDPAPKAKAAPKGSSPPTQGVVRQGRTAPPGSPTTKPSTPALEK